MKSFFVLSHYNFIFPKLLVDPASGLGNRLIILIIAALIAYFTRFILIRFMNRWMLSKSTKVDENIDTITPTSEIINTQKLSFEFLNSDTDLSTIANHRKDLVVQAKKMMKLQYFTDLLIILVYIIAGAFVFDDFIFDFVLDTQFAFSYFLYIIFYLIWTSLGYLGFKHQFTAYKDGIFDVIAPFWKFVFAVFKTKWKLLISLVLLLIALTAGIFNFIDNVVKGVVLLFSVGFHIFMYYRLSQKARSQPNLTLLILRVFLIAKTSLFTFSRLANFWKHFGSYFTVADPSFYKVFWKRNFKQSFPIVIILIFLVYTQLENSGGPSPFGPFIFFMIIGAIVFIVFSIRSMKRGFVQNESALQNELRRLKNNPVKLDGTFKETPISCYDNTWQITVNTLIENASVVLMDLRGFSEKNKGCEFEVNLLLNKIALNRILFIVYEDTVPLIKSTIERKFEMLEITSPNKNIKNSVATIFEVRKENNKETQYIMDILLNKALS
jgi:predicted Holliday junction resolvase-like endonuclease